MENGLKNESRKEGLNGGYHDETTNDESRKLIDEPCVQIRNENRYKERY